MSHATTVSHRNKSAFQSITDHMTTGHTDRPYCSCNLTLTRWPWYINLT